MPKDIITDAPKPPSPPDTTPHKPNSAIYSDPNAIRVYIVDEKTPILFLFGKPNCGKTMTLIRLSRYLRKQGYQIKPVRSFRPEEDTNYANLCDHFNDFLNSDTAAANTSNIDFMLLEISKGGNKICQILESPGELLTQYRDFPPFVNAIINSPNRKIYAIFVEPETGFQSNQEYVDRIRRMHSKQMKKGQDRAVVILNKIDKASELLKGKGYVNIPAAKNYIDDNYQGLFDIFANEHPITRLWRSHNCAFVPFQTGDFSESLSATTFTDGPEEYVRNLWRTVHKYIIG